MALLKAREAVMKEFIPHLREHALSPQQWRVMRALSAVAEEREMKEVAETCYLMLPSMSRIVQSLESRGLLHRRVSQRDARCTIISLSQKGADLVEKISPKSEQRYDKITELFGYGKLELLYELLEELSEKLNDGVDLADEEHG